MGDCKRSQPGGKGQRRSTRPYDFWAAGVKIPSNKRPCKSPVMPWYSECAGSGGRERIRSRAGLMSTRAGCSSLRLLLLLYCAEAPLRSVCPLVCNRREGVHLLPHLHDIGHG